MVWIVVVVIPIILRSLPNHSADARARSSSHDGSLQTAAEDRAQSRTSCRSNQSAFARPNPALVLPVVVMVRTIVWVVVVPAMSATAHTVVISAVVMRLREPGNNRRRKNKKNNKNRVPEPAHPRLDANSPSKAFPPFQTFASAQSSPNCSERANAVTAIFEQQGDIPLTNMLAPGAMGASSQVDSDATAEGQAENRRVVVRILQNKGVSGT